MKLGLGTVQFGLDYGISNNRGKVPFEKALSLLKTAYHDGVTVLDTAYHYGSAEAVLGHLDWQKYPFKIISKTAKIEAPIVSAPAIAKVRTQFLSSLKKLKQTTVYGLLVHHFPDLCQVGSEKLWHMLETLKSEQIVKKIGVSVYDPQDVWYVLEHFAPDLIQLPFNVLDQRADTSGVFAALCSRGIECHVRSVYLQGLLLMPADKIFNVLPRALMAVKRFQALCQDYKISPMGMALHFVDQYEEIAHMIVGVTCLQELRQAMNALADSRSTTVLEELKQLAVYDNHVINPSLWP